MSARPKIQLGVYKGSESKDIRRVALKLEGGDGVVRVVLLDADTGEALPDGHLATFRVGARGIYITRPADPNPVLVHNALSVDGHNVIHVGME